MTPQILCENVSVQYDRHPAVQNATFSVEPGDFLCIVGENGSGKSTLLKAMLGLLPLSGGQILFPTFRSRRGIGYVPQQSNIQKNFPATVWEIVLSGCLPQRKWRPFYTAADKPVSYTHLPGGAPINRDTEYFSIYSVISIRTMLRSSSNNACANALASSVLPTPVGPRSRNEPIGRFGS